MRQLPRGSRANHFKADGCSNITSLLLLNVIELRIPWEYRLINKCRLSINSIREIRSEQTRRIFTGRIIWKI